MVIVMKKYTFKKEERLCSKRSIDDLFHNGSSFVVYPFRVVYRFTTTNPDNAVPVECILSVSKRRFRKAVDRNRLKRQMREVYRLQKSDLYDFLQQHSLHLRVALQYVGKVKEPYAMLYQRMGKVLTELKDERTKIFMGEHH